MPLFEQFLRNSFDVYQSELSLHFLESNVDPDQLVSDESTVFHWHGSILMVKLHDWTGQKSEVEYSKTCVKWPLSKRLKIGFQNHLSPNAGQKYCRMLQWEHSAIFSNFIKLPFYIKIFVLSIFEWPFYTGFTVTYTYIENLHTVFDLMSAYAPISTQSYFMGCDCSSGRKTEKC